MATGCGATSPTPRDATAVGADEGDARPAPSTIATYGALTGVGVGAAAVGTYFMVEAENDSDRTGSRPEFWGGLQAVAGGAALAIPFGYLTASSLTASDEPARGAAAAPPRTARDGVTVRPRIGAGSIDVSGEF